MGNNGNNDDLALEDSNYKLDQAADLEEQAQQEREAGNIEVANELEAEAQDLRDSATVLDDDDDFTIPVM